MKKYLVLFLSAYVVSTGVAQTFHKTMPFLVKTANGMLAGTNAAGIISFKGIAFAQPPIGNLRWKEPQPVKNWQGVRKADKFGPRAMQRPLFSDMMFRSNGVDEDCLYLNVWKPAKPTTEKLPVLVYFYGGGLAGGDGSEYRYDGESMARKGIVAITVNYRLTIFGFLAHPELTKESPHHASGNYGLMDQYAALLWVKENIAAFGGDPNKITIAGESAGSFSVSAQMASPLSKTLIAGAIGESGSLLGANPPVPLAAAEQLGVKFAESVGAKSLAELRAMTAADILAATAKPETRFPVDVDGYFFTETPAQTFAAGKQAHVPLLVGWNSAESNYRSIIGQDAATVENYTTAVQKIYGDNAPNILKVYHAATDNDVQQVATDLASDRFIAFGTWRWSDMHASTSEKPVYRYFYMHPRPITKAESMKGIVPHQNADFSGASHSAEIEYALGNLATNKVYNWQPEDYKVSETMQAFFVHFIKTGNPNGKNLPNWTAIKNGTPANVMHIDVDTKAAVETTRDRYLLLQSLLK